MFDLAEEALDEVPILVDCSVEGAPTGGCGSSRNDWFCSGRSDGVHGALAVISFVCQDIASLQPLEQPLDLGDVIAFSTCQNEADWIAKRIGGGMNFGAQAAF